MDFAEFIAPTPVATFMSDHFGRAPVHIQGESARGSLLSMARLEELLSVLPHWTQDNLKLIINSRPVLGEHFLGSGREGAAPRADPAKVQLFLRMGASMVGDHVEDIDPAVRQVAAMLSDQFAATAGANVYCSFQDVRAFNSHCDLHEVFAVQLEGEKVWQIYENRAEAPVEALQGENAQAMIDRAKGKVMMTVRMQPGDLLYIPRGYFHDALASSSASLHLTFGIRPFDGRYIFRLLEEMVVRDPKFRAYLPDGRSDPNALREHLAGLADDVATMVGSPLMQMQLINRQRALVQRDEPIDVQDRRKLDYLAATGEPSEVVWSLAGATLRHRGGEEPLGTMAEAVEWAIGQAAFSEQQLRAAFGWLLDDEVGRIIQILTRSGLYTPYDPPL
jgi:ribosomal protein L16 Arg81 hydroxylase